MRESKARRYNEGKLRYELVPDRAYRKLVEVYTKGAAKYTTYDDNGYVLDDGANNWRKGQSWMKAMASVERHIAAWKRGEDFDPDPAMGTYHLANAAWGLFMLLEFYHIHPYGDDRHFPYEHMPKIGLDIDEVIANWLAAWCKKFNLDHNPTTWFFDREIMNRFEELREKGELDHFYLGLEPLIKPEDIPFEPHCYITSRPVDNDITMKWLDMHGFPTRPVFTVEPNKTKVDIAKEQKLDMFVDDRYENFVELNRAGILCYLMDRPHNHRYNVGFKRINNLKDLEF